MATRRQTDRHEAASPEGGAGPEAEAGRAQDLPLGEAVFRALRQDLRDGRYRPGDRLREDEIAKRLAVSRTPVREALARLVAKGLIESAGGRGLVVRALGTAEVMELYAMREILEGAAARLAAQHAAPAEIQVLEDLAAAFAAPGADLQQQVRVNQAFHEAILAAARNRYVDGALQELQDAISLLGPTTFSVTGRTPIAAAEHRAIVAAIAARDGDRAEALARAHIQQALRARLALLHARR